MEIPVYEFGGLPRVHQSTTRSQKKVDENAEQAFGCRRRAKIGTSYSSKAIQEKFIGEKIALGNI